MTRSKIFKTYEYLDESRNLLFQQVRYEPKAFRQRRPDGKGGWIWALGDTRRVLYRLPELIAATMQDWVSIVEGEKDCDRLWREGYPATCAPMGANGWREEFNQHFRGRLVAILPDNDDPGRKYAQRIAESLYGIAAEIRIVELPGLGKGGDVSDFLDGGGTREQLLDLLNNCSPYTPPASLTAESRESHPYRETETGLVWVKRTNEGETAIPLTNFTARIVSDCAYDDGVETTSTLEIETCLEDRRSRCKVTATDFISMNWPIQHMGAGAIIYPGTSKKEHARAAIQCLSKGVVRQNIYTHTGWRKIEDEWAYLHAGGAIGKRGAISDVVTCLPDSLSLYHLPAPLSGVALCDAIRASMRILDLVPRRIGWPLYCLPRCAVLGIGTFSCHLVGHTGTGKSQLAALIQQHFGPAMDATRLPGSWSSTSNALQALAFGAKDALLTVDDFAPNGSQSDIQQLHRKASELTRSQANRSARQRMRSDTTLRPSKPPRGLILSTGEDIPRGQSIQARMMIVELGQEDLNWRALTACQGDAESGLYAQVLSAFIRWISERYEQVQDKQKARVIELRAQLQKAGLHRRTPTMIAEAAQGIMYFLEFAVECGAVTIEEQQRLWEDCWSELLLVSESQSVHQGSADPAVRFRELICSALASGTAHAAAPDGHEPDNPKAWGWRERQIPHSLEKAYDPMGTRIGWTDGQCVYLDPDASYKVAQSMTGNGDGIPVAANTLRKRLKERGDLIVDEKRETLTVRRVLDGAQRKVLCFPTSVFGQHAHGQPDIPDISDSGYDAGGPERDSVSVEVSGSAREYQMEPDMAT